MNVALIGLGMVASTHVRAIAALSPDIQLKTVYGRDKLRTTQFADDAATILGYRPEPAFSVEAIADDSAIDFVIVATPPNARLEITKILAAAGKSILMEKPIERTLESAKKIADLCADHDVKLGIIFQHRVRQASTQLRNMLETGALGPIGIVEIVVPWWREQSYYDAPGRGTFARDGGGVLISQAIHSLDLALSLAGSVHKVQAMAKTSRFHQMEAEDYVTAGLEFECGAIGSLVASTASFPGTSETITLHCDNASAHLEAGQLTITWRDGKTDVFGEETGTGGGANPMAFTHEWHQEIIRDFASAVINNTEPLVSGRTGLIVHALIDALITSANSERSVTLAPWNK
ncbi:Gfo/Idh/MocA family oxidoreductase (plasmid) [Phyllobacterium sp. 628]|uniref:Gfo/Idh/MocA family protein n=1 Tax=Phyllobacterium sp. 628 TaxID=2718938 RepID=UPI0016627DD1|nr:Gfo/Idh/MocA family oxidoreductase [Phyllobacterium sp. 628]QND54459.1 Gfo/Idh/MocA family oxidoreductase [Phyllobacterium sp. 628]